MKPTNASDDEKLRTLLRATRPVVTLPPRFQENVWRRIENAESHKGPLAAYWFDALATWILRPRLALTFATVLLVAGFGFGWNHGQENERQEAQDRYLAAVAPNILH